MIVRPSKLHMVKGLHERSCKDKTACSLLPFGSCKGGSMDLSMYVACLDPTVR